MSLEIKETTKDISAKKEIDGNYFKEFKVGANFKFDYTEDGVTKTLNKTIKAGESGYIKLIYKLFKEV